MRGVLSKKGSHVGMILSFLIFVTFIAFLYSAIAPVTKMQKDKQVVLDFLKMALVENSSGDLTIVTVSLGNEKCGELNVDEIDVNNLNIIVKDSDGGILDFKKSGNNVKFSNEAFKVYFSKDIESLREGYFDSGSVKCKKIDPSLVKTETEVFESKIGDMLYMYENNYEVLKEGMNVPAGSDFGFEFVDTLGDSIKTEDKNIRTDIYAEEISFLYIDSEANILQGSMIIKVW